MKTLTITESLNHNVGLVWEIISDLSRSDWVPGVDEISINSAQSAIEWILEANFKNTEKKHKELNLVICSPGGDLAAG